MDRDHFNKMSKKESIHSNWNDVKGNESYAGVLSDFDIQNMEIYSEQRYLLHFQWGATGPWRKIVPKVCRYALVEMIDVDKIDSRNKQKEDEVGLTQKEIWDKKYRPKNGST